MTLLINAIIDGITYHISNEQVALSNQFYDDDVLSISSIKYSTPKRHGGYTRLTYSSFSLNPKLFPEDSWPPPVEIKVDASYTDNAGNNEVGLFEATGHLSKITRTSVEYNLYGSNHTEVLTSQAFSGTLLSIFETYTGQTHLNLVLEPSLARAPSPDVVYTADGELLDILSDIAAFFSHMFYIKSGTLYLVDMLQTTDTAETAEDIFLEGTQYRNDVPHSLFTADIYSVAGSHPYGDSIDISPVCHDTQANIESALADIKIIYERQKVEISFPLDHDRLQTLGGLLSWTDDSLVFSTNCTMGVRSITYNFDKSEFTCSGEGITSSNS